MADEDARLQELVATVSAAYFSNTPVSAQDIGNVIGQIAASLSAVRANPALAQDPPASETPAEPEAVRKPTPAQVRRSIGEDGIVSFEDGKAYKTLRRHLATRGLTPEQYREKWGLPRDYPMVSPSYSARRSALAKAVGLGQKRRGAGPQRGKPARGRFHKTGA